MIDRPSRDSLALLLRRLANGRVSNYEYMKGSVPLTESRDPALAAIEEIVWSNYCDCAPRRYVGRHQLSRAGRRDIARIVVFLRSDVEYEWPAQPRSTLLRAMAVLLTFGLSELFITVRHASMSFGDLAVWPFLRNHDFETVTRQPAFRAIPRATAG